MIVKYLEKWKDNKAIEYYDIKKNEIKYKQMRNNIEIRNLSGDEEYVRAYIITKLVNELGYSMKDISFEKEYTIGRPKKEKARIDIVVYKQDKNDIFMFIELKSPEKFKKEKESAIQYQLYALAAQEKELGNNIDYLVYYSINENDFSDSVILIDYNEYNNYSLWKDKPNYYTKILTSYNKMPNGNEIREFGVNDIDSRIENIISSLNQHIKYNEIKDSLLFVNICILSLFNEDFRKEIINGFYDNEETNEIVRLMENIIVKNDGEIDKYQFTNNENKKSINSLIKSTCTSMKAKKELSSSIYSLNSFLKDIAKKIFPIILYGTNEDKLLISETIYK